MEYDGDRLVIEKETLSNLDEFVLRFTEVLDRTGVQYVVVAGYVAILLGRSRATEDVDIIIEPLSESETDALAEALDDAGYWGVEEPLENMYDRLTDDIATRIAPDGEVIPNFEVVFPQDGYDRHSLTEAIEAELAGRTLRIGPLELQVAYKLHLGSQKDFEDALHLYTLFADRLDTEELERFVDGFEVNDSYERLRDA